MINHREVVVDGTKFDPQLSVMYEPSSDVAEPWRLLRPPEPDRHGALTATGCDDRVEALQVSSADVRNGQ